MAGEKDEAGYFIAISLADYSTMQATGKMAWGPRGAMRLQYHLQGDEWHKPSGNTQFVLSPPQATELARALLREVEILQSKDPWSSQPHPVDLGTQRNKREL